MVRAMAEGDSNSRRVSASISPRERSTAPGRIQRFMTHDGFSFTYKFAKGQLKHPGHLPDALPGPTAQQLDAGLESGPLAAPSPPGCAELEEQSRLAEASRKRVSDNEASGQATSVAMAADVLLQQEQDNLVAYLRLKKLMLRGRLAELDPAQASKKRPAAAVQPEGAVASDEGSAGAEAAGQAWDAMGDESDQTRHGAGRARRDASKRARSGGGGWMKPKENKERVIAQPVTVFTRNMSLQAREARLAQLSEVLDSGWLTRRGPASELDQRRRAAQDLPLHHADRPLPYFQLQNQRKACSRLSGRHNTYINAWLEAGLQCCPLPFQLAPFHTEVGKALDWDSMSTKWVAVALGLIPEPPELSCLVATAPRSRLCGCTNSLMLSKAWSLAFRATTQISVARGLSSPRWGRG